MAYIILLAIVLMTVAFIFYVWFTMARGRKKAVPHLTVSDIVAPGDRSHL